MREVQLFNRLGDEMEEGNRKLVLIRVRINRELEGDREIAWGLVNSRHPFLWVVRPGLIEGSKWLEPLPSGFMAILQQLSNLARMLSAARDWHSADISWRDTSM